MAIDTAPFSRRRPGDTTCCPLNATPQRPATASPPPDGNTTDFYGPINLAKALTSLDGAAALDPRAAAGATAGIVEIRGFGRCEGETKINYIAIAPAQYGGRYSPR
jgi:hypothetical protein